MKVKDEHNNIIINSKWTIKIWSTRTMLASQQTRAYHRLPRAEQIKYIHIILYNKLWSECDYSDIIYSLTSVSNFTTTKYGCVKHSISDSDDAQYAGYFRTSNWLPSR